VPLLGSHMLEVACSTGLLCESLTACCPHVSNCTRPQANCRKDSRLGQFCKEDEPNFRRRQDGYQLSSKKSGKK